MSEFKLKIIVCTGLIALISSVLGFMVGLDVGSPTTHVKEIVWVNAPDTIRMEAFGMRCWLIPILEEGEG